MSILSPSTIELHQNFRACVEVLNEEPAVDELEEFLSTARGRRSKKASDLERPTYAASILGVFGNGGWLSCGVVAIVYSAEQGLPMPDPLWIAGAFAGPVLSQLALVLGSKRAEKIAQPYHEALSHREGRIERLCEDITDARSKMLSSVAADLRRCGFVITRMDERNQSFTTHQGVVSLMTDPDGRLVATLNGAPLRASYGAQAMFDGVALTDATGSQVPTRAPIVLG